MAKYYIMIIASGLVLAAALILVVSNIGNECANINFFWTTLNQKSLGLVMFLSALGGLLVWQMLKWFTRGSWRLYRARKEAGKAERKVEGRVQKRIEKEKKPEKSSQDESAGE